MSSATIEFSASAFSTPSPGSIRPSNNGLPDSAALGSTGYRSTVQHSIYVDLPSTTFIQPSIYL